MYIGGERCVRMGNTHKFSSAEQMLCRKKPEGLLLRQYRSFHDDFGQNLGLRVIGKDCDEEICKNIDPL